jgi:membrane protein DedA with SNARE-associated domain
MPVGRFLLFSALGSLPWNAALVLAGYLLGENYRHLYDAVRPFELVIYVVVVVGVAYVIYRWLRGRGGATATAARSGEGDGGG